MMLLLFLCLPCIGLRQPLSRVVSHVPCLSEKRHKVLRLCDALRDGRSARLSGTDGADVRSHLCNHLTVCHLRPALGSISSRQLGTRGTTLACIDRLTGLLSQHGIASVIVCKVEDKADSECVNDSHVVRAPSCTTSAGIGF
jgi:hypothetical protein